MLDALDHIETVFNEQQDQINNAHTNLMSQLYSHQQNLVAIRHYLRALEKKAWQCLQMQQMINTNNHILQTALSNWKLSIKITKLQNLLHYGKVFRKLQHHRNRKLMQNIQAVQEMSADNCYDRCLKARIFAQWKVTVAHLKKNNILHQFIKLNALTFFVNECARRKSNDFTKQLVDSMGKEKMMEKVFKGWVSSTKQVKVQKIIIANKFTHFLTNLKQHCKQQRAYYHKHRRKTILSQSFNKLKQNREFEKWTKYYKLRLLSTSFRTWIKAGEMLYYEKQQELKNQEILNEYRSRKIKILTLYCFQKWRSLVQEQLQNRNKCQIAKDYGEIKVKEGLLRKYFYQWKLLKGVNCALHFNERRLKNKVLAGWKNQIIKGADRWDRVYKFVEKREKRKYFEAIQQYIHDDKQKIRQFVTMKAWNKLGMAVVKSYMDGIRKADSYHNSSLKFKTFYALKYNLNLKIKTQKVFQLINVTMNLRRWHRRYAIKQFVEQRKFVIKAKVFRELKLARMGKIWSQKESISPGTQKRVTNYKMQQTKTEMSCEFSKIELESPQNIFALDYSITPYNSNNMENMDKF